MADDAHREGKPIPPPLIRDRARELRPSAILGGRQINRKPLLIRDRARELRRVSTDAERIPNELSGKIKGVLDTIGGQLTASPRGERPREARVRERSA
jgi:hypothetical protein